MIAAIPKTIQGYACVTPRTEKIWHGTGSRNDSVAILNKESSKDDCCQWRDISKMFDTEDDGIETFSYFDADESIFSFNMCNCQGQDRFLTITLSKPSFVRALILKPRKSLLDDNTYAKYTNF